MTKVQKLLVEKIHASIVDAGCVPVEFKNTQIGLFIANNLNKEEKRMNGQIFQTVFDFQGPVQMFDDKFSSSFIALDAARRAILGCKCQRALVCGVDMTNNGVPVVACVFIQKKELKSDSMSSFWSNKSTSLASQRLLSSNCRRSTMTGVSSQPWSLVSRTSVNRLKLT